MDAEVNHWFAVQTEPKCEKKVARLLIQKGYECLLPIYKQRRSWCYKAVETQAPLFPMYVLCKNTKSTIGKVVVTPGVRRIVGFGAQPSIIPEEEIIALKRLSDSNLLREPWEYLPDGALIQIETGPMVGLRGLYVRTDDKRRLVISIEILQRSVAVQLSDDTVITVIDEGDKAILKSSTESYLAMKLLKRAKDMNG
jgi:transcription termination/antitermination protein NusG